MIETLTLEQFVPQLGTEFICRAPDGAGYPLRLTEATAAGKTTWKGAGDSEPRTPFSLIFQGPADTFFPQSIYPLEHEAFGTLDLFIVPIGKEEEGFLYQAIFT